MYREPILKVCKIDNGYLIEVEVPMKEESTVERGCCCGPTYVEREDRDKMYYAKDETELATKVAEIIPMLTSPDPEKAFKSAFDTKE